MLLEFYKVVNYVGRLFFNLGKNSGKIIVGARKWNSNHWDCVRTEEASTIMGGYKAGFNACTNKVCKRKRTLHTRDRGSTKPIGYCRDSRCHIRKWILGVT